VRDVLDTQIYDVNNLGVGKVDGVFPDADVRR
jgi:hypothetical protein